MNRRLLAAAFVALAGGISSASAADIPRKAPMAAPVVAPGYNWTGFYIGAHAGWAWSDVDASTTFLPTPLFFGAAPFSYAHDADGGMVGGQIGVNYQISNWVVGVEADLSWTDIGGTASVSPIGTFPGPGVFAGSFHTSATDMNWFGTVRGRLGLAVNNLLIYATGGLAFGEIDYATFTFFPAGFSGAASGSKTLTGWTLGGGLEWGFAPNWSVKAEYLYFDLGDTTGTTAPDPIFAPAGVSTTFEHTGHIARIGLNYRFGHGGPVAARY